MEGAGTRAELRVAFLFSTRLERLNSGKERGATRPPSPPTAKSLPRICEPIYIIGVSAHAATTLSPMALKAALSWPWYSLYIIGVAEYAATTLSPTVRKAALSCRWHSLYIIGVAAEDRACDVGTTAKAVSARRIPPPSVYEKPSPLCAQATFVPANMTFAARTGIDTTHATRTPTTPIMHALHFIATRPPYPPLTSLCAPFHYSTAWFVRPLCS